MGQQYYKSSSSSQRGTVTWVRTRFNGSQDTVIQQNNTIKWTDFLAGETNLKWKEQVAAGRQAGTIMDGERLHVSVSPCYLRQRALPTGVPSATAAEYLEISGIYVPSIPSYPGSYSEVKADNLALAQLVTKIRDKQTTFQGGVFVGELKQSIGLITNPARALRKAFNRLYQRNKRYAQSYRRRRSAGSRKRRNDQDRRDLINACAESWLEWNLGWAPLISEVDGAVQALAESGIMENPQWETVRAFGVDVIDVNESIVTHGTSRPLYRVRRVQTDEVLVRYIACVSVGTYSVSSPRRVGFAPSNWVPTLWELIPYSFVIDYFANIGNIVSAATLNTSTIRWVLKTVVKSRKIKDVEWRPVLTSNNSLYNYYAETAKPGNLSIERRVVHREPYTGSLVPSLQFNIDLGSKQWLNIAGLLQQRNKLRSYTR